MNKTTLNIHVDGDIARLKSAYSMLPSENFGLLEVRALEGNHLHQYETKPTIEELHRLHDAYKGKIHISYKDDKQDVLLEDTKVLKKGYEIYGRYNGN